ncbi:hypothetical protein CC1G_02301 [Coprinopsis cinerea okayama7|uniref:Uncharacterized protein n=1 Tax=Coprinopsis cinerea (strain Okayama-7 / 130 / ATCC MYA-4618 / FGSC 9003) TaxID=240176 RepID=A8N7P4_COPC7|nr:hypothetical protein CC1G_02301 [Coprinopsis cinerea okayama7\|eukprot:XP_001830850.2 hypothetical protein CC1G_02301 [Coprinopsis cinerea okayama7\
MSSQPAQRDQTIPSMRAEPSHPRNIRPPPPPPPMEPVNLYQRRLPLTQGSFAYCRGLAFYDCAFIDSSSCTSANDHLDAKINALQMGRMSSTDRSGRGEGTPEERSSYLKHPTACLIGVTTIVVGTCALCACLSRSLRR